MMTHIWPTEITSDGFVESEALHPSSHGAFKPTGNWSYIQWRGVNSNFSEFEDYLGNGDGWDRDHFHIYIADMDYNGDGTYKASAACGLGKNWQPNQWPHYLYNSNYLYYAPDWMDNASAGLTGALNESWTPEECCAMQYETFESGIGYPLWWDTEQWWDASGYLCEEGETGCWVDTPEYMDGTPLPFPDEFGFFHPFNVSEGVTVGEFDDPAGQYSKINHQLYVCNAIPLRAHSDALSAYVHFQEDLQDAYTEDSDELISFDYNPPEQTWAWAGFSDYDMPIRDNLRDVESKEHHWAIWTQSEECYSNQRCLFMGTEHPRMTYHYSNWYGAYFDAYDGSYEDPSNHLHKRLNQYQKIYSRHNSEVPLEPFSSIKVSFWMKTVNWLCNDPYVDLDGNGFVDSQFELDDFNCDSSTGKPMIEASVVAGDCINGEDDDKYLYGCGLGIRSKCKQ